MKNQKRSWRAIYNFNDTSETLYPTEFGHGIYTEGLNSGMRERDAFCLHFVFSGTGTFNNDDVHAGNAFFSLPGQKFIYIASNLCKWEHFYILFKGTEAMDFLKPFISKYENQVFEFDCCNEMYKNLHSFMYAEKKHNQYGFLALLYYLVSSEKCSCKKSKEDYVSGAMALIQHNYCFNITVMEIARALSISPRYLTRAFKEYTGRTVQEQILYKKIEHAKTFLKNSDLKIRDIAHSLGYENEFAFSSAFKKRVGISPRQYKSAD